MTTVRTTVQEKTKSERGSDEMINALFEIVSQQVDAKNWDGALDSLEQIEALLEGSS